MRPLVVGEKLVNEKNKNWLPFVVDGVNHFIYSWNPLQVYRLEDSGECVLIHEKVLSKHNFEFRGSACPVPYQGGWLMTVHQIHYRANGSRLYFHRLVWLSADYEEYKISIPFYFIKVDVEYNLGICWDKTGENLLIAHSLRDNTAEITTVSSSIIDNMLNANIINY